MANLPVAGRMAEELPDWDLRVFIRDKNLDIMSEYLKDGQFMSVPCLVFFDNDFNEMGRWIERPHAADEFGTRLTEELKALPPEQARPLRRQRMAEEYRHRLLAETLREIRQLLSR